MATTKTDSSILLDARNALHSDDMEMTRTLLERLSDGEGVAEKQVDFWRDAADLMRDAGMLDDSVQAWRRAEEQGLDATVARTQIAATDLLAGRFEEAREALALLSGDHPRNAAIRNLHALALFEDRRYAEARAEWDEALRSSAQTHCPLSTHPLYLSLGAMALEGYLLREPASEPPVRSDEEAEQSAKARAPGRTRNARLAAIEKAIEHREYAQALEWADVEPRKEGEEPGMLNLFRSWALAENGRWHEARAELSAVLAQPEANPSAASYYGYCLVRSGEPGTALALLDTVASAGPDDFFANYFKGSAHVALGNRLAAARAFQVGFADYFFDTYHCVLVPAWDKVLDRLKQTAEPTG